MGTRSVSIECPACDGEGRVKTEEYNAYGKVTRTIETNCDHCQGNGIVLIEVKDEDRR